MHLISCSISLPLRLYALLPPARRLMFKYNAAFRSGKARNEFLIKRDAAIVIEACKSTAQLESIIRTAHNCSKK